MREWEAIEPYEARPGQWLGRVQIVWNETTTEADTCEHYHADKSAAWACGQELAATQQAAGEDLSTPRAAQVRAFLVRRYGGDMVTDAMVASVLHGLTTCQTARPKRT